MKILSTFQNLIFWLSNLLILSVHDEGYFEHTWWRLFWVSLMKVILSVPDEGYFECIWLRLFWAYLMKVILSIPDKGYFECIWWRLFWVYLMKVILSVSDEGYFERTWWRLFQKHIVHTKFDIYVFYSICITEISFEFHYKVNSQHSLQCSSIFLSLSQMSINVLFLCRVIIL